MNEPDWKEWGPPTRVRIEPGPVWLIARAVKDRSPLYASEQAAKAAGFPSVPCPPTFTFAVAHAGARPDLQPESRTADAAAESLSAVEPAGPGLYLHGEQEFVYHRHPMVGDVLEGRTRTSLPRRKDGGRQPMELTWYQTRWCDLDGAPVVDELITSIYLPDGSPT